MYYNSLQYAFRVWLTSALAIPHIYILYYAVSSARAACFPVSGYIALLVETLLLAMPIGLIFMIVVDMMRNTGWPANLRRIISLTVLETLLLLTFTIIIHGVGNKMISWSSCLDYVVISCFTIAVCCFTYQLKPQNKPGKQNSFENKKRKHTFSGT